MSPEHHITGAWHELARALHNRYSADWQDRLRSYEEGTNPDLQLWRALGDLKTAEVPQ